MITDLWKIPLFIFEFRYSTAEKQWTFQERKEIVEHNLWVLGDQNEHLQYEHQMKVTVRQTFHSINLRCDFYGLVKITCFYDSWWIMNIHSSNNTPCISTSYSYIRKTHRPFHTTVMLSESDHQRNNWCLSSQNEVSTEIIVGSSQNVSSCFSLL